MTRISLWTSALALGLIITTVASAIPPAYIGPMGNLEEPALRPYKWLVRGIKAFAFQTVSAIDQGNRKTPALGMAEGFRGMRKGAVEAGESCFKGAMLFSPPPHAGDYKKLGGTNKCIDNDLLLSNVADYVFASQFLVWCHSHEAWGWGLLIWAAQKHVDCCPAVSPAEQERMNDKAKMARAAAKAKTEIKPMTRKEAQTAYIGERIPQQRKDPYKGNILDLVR